jgi:diguanylate cyclase (GGDEF)-like protein
MNQESKDLEKYIKDLEEKVHNLEKDLIHDKLTGLKSRGFLEEEASVYLGLISNPTTSQRKDWFGFKNMSFIFFDIDFFKKINDTYGHGVGDDVLKVVASTIKSSLREGDTVARWGGEEILATLVGATEKDAKDKAESIRGLIEKLTFQNSPELKVTISAGVASAEPKLSLEEIVKRADEALYKAKETGRNKVVLYSEIG